MLAADCGADLITICGPTGTGKSTLGKFLVETELRKQATAMSADPGLVPAIWVEATSSGEDEFSWRLFYQAILTELEGDLDAPRTAYGVDPATGRVVRPIGVNTNRLSSLRKAVERSLKRRRTRFIVVDEAAHILKGCRPKKLEKQLDTLKSLANKTGVRWLLTGSYDLFELMSLSGQLARRTHVMHLSRYREDDDEDELAFNGCLKKFGQSIPALHDIDLLSYSQVFQQNTLGCVGTLRDVLVRLAVQVERKGWSEETLQGVLLTDAQVRQITHEILEGEDRIVPGLHRTLLPSNLPLERRAA